MTTEHDEHWALQKKAHQSTVIASDLRARAAREDERGAEYRKQLGLGVESEVEELAATLNDSVEPYYYPFDWHEATGIAASLLASGYRKPRTITTREEIRNLPALTVVIHDDMATGGPLQAFVVPDDGTVMFKDGEEFHLMNFSGDYIDAKDMPLPLTVVYEVAS